MIIGQIFASERGVPHLINALAGGDPLPIAIHDVSLKTRFCGLRLHFAVKKVLLVYLHPLLRNQPRKLPNSVKLGLLRFSKSSKVTEFGSLVPIESSYATSYW